MQNASIPDSFLSYMAITHHSAARDTNVFALVVHRRSRGKGACRHISNFAMLEMQTMYRVSSVDAVRQIEAPKRDLGADRNTQRADCHNRHLNECVFARPARPGYEQRRLWQADPTRGTDAFRFSGWQFHPGPRVQSADINRQKRENGEDDSHRESIADVVDSAGTATPLEVTSTAVGQQTTGKTIGAKRSIPEIVLPFLREWGNENGYEDFGGKKMLGVSGPGFSSIFFPSKSSYQ